jgi:RNA polymerase sigma factor (TIGR02999 family)
VIDITPARDLDHAAGHGVRRLLVGIMAHGIGTSPSASCAPIHRVDVAAILAERLLGDFERIARRRLSRERSPDFEAASLVNEVYLRLAQNRRFGVNSDTHVLALASIYMGRVLIDDARRRHAGKRPQGPQVDLGDVDVSVPPVVERTLMVREALARLASKSPRRAAIVRLRFLEDRSLSEVAVHTRLSLATVKRELNAGIEDLRDLLQRS